MRTIVQNINTGKYFLKTCCGGKIHWTPDKKKAFVFNDTVGLTTRITDFKNRLIQVKLIKVD